MLYAIIYYFIIVKHLVISAAPLLRPTVRILNNHKSKIVTNGPSQVLQPLELHQDQWLKPKLTTSLDDNQYMAAGILQNNMASATDGQRPAAMQTDFVLRQHDVQAPVQYQFQQTFEKPFEQKAQYQLQQQNQHAVQPMQFKRPVQRPFQQPFQSSFQNPYQPPIQKPYQLPIQKPFQAPIQESYLEPVQSPNPWNDQPTQQPIDMMNQQPLTMSDFAYEPTTQMSFYSSRRKRIRRGHLRQRKKNKASSSTRPPYPNGLRPLDDKKDSDGEYIMCDGNAICQKHEWTTKQSRMRNNRRNNIVLVKSFIH